MDRILNKLGNLKTRLADITKSRRAALSGHESFVKKADEDFKKFSEQSERDLTAALEVNRSESQQRQECIETRSKSHGMRARKAAANLKAKLEKQINDRKNAWTTRRQQALDQATKTHEAKRAAFEADSAQNMQRVEAMGVMTVEQREDIIKLARKNGVSLDTKRARATQQPETTLTLDAFDSHLAAQHDEIESARKTIGAPISAMTCIAISLALCFGAWGFLFRFDYRNPLAAAIVIVFVVLCVIIYSVFSNIKERSVAISNDLFDRANESYDLYEMLKARENDNYMAGIAALGCERVENTHDAEEKSQQQMMLDSQPLRDAIFFLQERRDNLLARVQQRHDKARKELADRSTLAENTLRDQRNKTVSDRRSEFISGKASSETEKTQTLERLAAEWKSAIADCQTFLADLKHGFSTTHPPWNAPNYACRLPDDFIKEVPIGSIGLDSKNIAPDADAPFSVPESIASTIPVVLSFPLCGSLYIRSSIARRDDAMNIVSSTILNLLRSFPPAKTKLTIIDPIGLGQNFAGLMHLADYDETLVNGRIWSDGAHIERKLTELTEHMEKVIQKFLRNRYA